MNAGILAVRQSCRRDRRDDVSLEELIYETVQGLLSQEGASIDDVDHVAIASSDGLDGRAISSMVTMSSAGGYFRSLINCSSSGEHALVMALLTVLAGRSRMALVVNWGKPSETPLPVVDNLAFDPFFYRDLRLERTSLLALQAQAYAGPAGVSPGLAARLAAYAVERAARNPFALPRPATSAEAIAASPLVASPLRAGELPPPADGAVAMLVGTREAARSVHSSFVAVTGMGWAYDSYWSGSRDLRRLSSLEAAAARAFKQAGISDPAAQLDVAELMDLTPYHLLMTGEALGIAPEGGARLGEAMLSGSAPVAIIPSGGLHGGYTDFASGLERVAELYGQLTGRAAAMQVPGARRGVAQAASGWAGQVSSVFVLDAAVG